MPNELKPEDVMRALECHATDYKPPMEGVFHCKTDCPYHQFDFCTRVLTQDALALLREKDAEIERLNALNKVLKDNNSQCHRLGYEDAITEFAERLKAKKCHYTETEHTFDFDGVTVEDIEQTAKELKEAPK